MGDCGRFAGRIAPVASRRAREMNRWFPTELAVSRSSESTTRCFDTTASAASAAPRSPRIDHVPEPPKPGELGEPGDRPRCLAPVVGADADPVVVRNEREVEVMEREKADGLAGGGAENAAPAAVRIGERKNSALDDDDEDDARASDGEEADEARSPGCVTEWVELDSMRRRAASLKREPALAAPGIPTPYACEWVSIGECGGASGAASEASWRFSST